MLLKKRMQQLLLTMLEPVMLQVRATNIMAMALPLRKVMVKLIQPAYQLIETKFVL